MKAALGAAQVMPISGSSRSATGMTQTASRQERRRARVTPLASKQPSSQAVPLVRRESMSSILAWMAVVVSLAAWATRRLACWNQAEPLASHLPLPSWSPEPCLRCPSPESCLL